MSSSRVFLIVALVEPLVAIVVFVVGVRVLKLSSPKQERRKPPVPAEKRRLYVVGGRRD